jgi:hypothetical protein
LDESDLSDVIIVCQDQEMLAHRVVLAAQSPVLARLLTAELKQTTLSSSTQAILRLERFQSLTVRRLLRFCYSGSVALDPDSDSWTAAVDLFQLACHVHVFTLAELCVPMVGWNLSDLNLAATARILLDVKTTATEPDHFRVLSLLTSVVDEYRHRFVVDVRDVKPSV